MTGINFKYSKAIFILFILVLGIILYTSVFNSDLSNISITGNFLKSNNNSEGDVDIEANLTIDSLELDGYFDKIVFASVSQSNLEVGKSNFKTKNDSQIILENYDGGITLNPEKIVKLDGDADRIETEGGSYEGETSVVIENLKYKNLKIKGVDIKKFDKPVSGIVDVEGTYGSLEDDNLLIKKFKGEVNSKGSNSSIFLEGTAKGVRSKNIEAGNLGLFS